MQGQILGELDPVNVTPRPSVYTDNTKLNKENYGGNTDNPQLKKQIDNENTSNPLLNKQIESKYTDNPQLNKINEGESTSNHQVGKKKVRKIIKNKNDTECVRKKNVTEVESIKKKAYNSH